MKRVTFRVPEDHEIAVSLEFEEATVTATYGDLGLRVAISKNGEEYGGYAYGWYPTLDEAQTWAKVHARKQLRRQVLSNKALAALA